jgi:uncharacterized membrane protein
VYDAGVYTTLALPGATHTYTAAINDNGQVAGYYSGADDIGHGFIYDAGTYTTIDVPGAVSTYGHGINGIGQVVGFFDDGSTQRAYMYDANTYTTLASLGSFYTIAVDINNAGQIVGYYDDGSSVRAFLATPTRSVAEPSTLRVFAVGLFIFCGLLWRRRGVTPPAPDSFWRSAFPLQ